MKKYKIGMYGGKFMPFHKGHAYCIDVAAKECELVYAILFTNGTDELNILSKDNSLFLSAEERFKRLELLCSKYDNVIPVIIDTINCKNEDGTENWDAETPLTRAIFGPKLDAVYSSEESYGEYFSRAYPEAIHRLVDIKRIHYPISGTQIRNMDSKEEQNKWIL